MGGSTAAFVAELKRLDSLLLADLLLIGLLDSFREDASEIHGGDGDVAVSVAGDVFEFLRWEHFREALADADDAEGLFLFRLASDHRGDDAVDEGVEVHEFALDGFTVLLDLFDIGVLADDVFDADDEARSAGDGGTVGEPAGAAPHRFDEEVGAVAGGVGDEVADLGSEGFDGGEVAEGEVDAAVVVVDGLGDMDNADLLGTSRQAFLKETELVGGFEGVVAADGDEGIDFERSKSFIDRLEGRGLCGVLHVRGSADEFAGVVAGGANEDPTSCAIAFQFAVIEADVVAAFLHGVVRTELHEPRIAVLDANDIDPAAKEGIGGGADDGVGCWGWSAREEDSNPLQVGFWGGGPSESRSHVCSESRGSRQLSKSNAYGSERVVKRQPSGCGRKKFVWRTNGLSCEK